MQRLAVYEPKPVHSYSKKAQNSEYLICNKQHPWSDRMPERVYGTPGFGGSERFMIDQGSTDHCCRRRARPLACLGVGTGLGLEPISAPGLGPIWPKPSMDPRPVGRDRPGGLWGLPKMEFGLQPRTVGGFWRKEKTLKSGGLGQVLAWTGPGPKAPAWARTSKHGHEIGTNREASKDEMRRSRMPPCSYPGIRSVPAQRFWKRHLFKLVFLNR